MGKDLGVQNPRLISLLMSLGSGAFMTVSQPVDRRLTFFPDRLAQSVTLAFPPCPILRCVARKNASSALALVMRVFSSLRVSLSISFRKCLISCLISSASFWLPQSPIIQSSAYLRYLRRIKRGSFTTTDGSIRRRAVSSLDSRVLVLPCFTILRFFSESAW